MPVLVRVGIPGPMVYPPPDILPIPLWTYPPNIPPTPYTYPPSRAYPPHFNMPLSVDTIGYPPYPASDTWLPSLETTYPTPVDDPGGHHWKHLPLHPVNRHIPAKTLHYLPAVSLAGGKNICIELCNITEDPPALSS